MATNFLSLRSVANYNTASSTNFSQGSYAAGAWVTSKTGITRPRTVASSSTGQYQIIISEATSSLWLSADTGATWSALGAAQGLPTLTGTAYWSAGSISSSGRQILLSVHGGGLWFSADSGRTFATSPQATPDIWLPLNGSVTDLMGGAAPSAVGSPTYVTVQQPGYSQQAVNIANTAGGPASKYIRGAWSGYSNFTASGWFTTQTVNGTFQVIFSAHSAVSELFINSSNQIVAQFASGNGSTWNQVVTSYAVSPNTWYYFTMTFQVNGTCSLWINNNLIGSVANTGGYGSYVSSGYYALGIYDHGVTGYSAFNGYIADFRLYGSAVPYVAVPQLAPSIWLPFEGSTADTGSNAITPSITGSVSYVPGAVGLTAVNFVNTAGSNATNYLLGTYTVPTLFTVSFWINPQSLGVQQTIFGVGSNGFTLYMTSANNLGLYRSTIGVVYTSSAPLQLNTWYHIHMTFVANGTGSIYLNGTLGGTYSCGVALTGSGYFSLGTSDTNILFAYNGYIDDFRLYNAIVPYSSLFPANVSHLTLSGDGQYAMAANSTGHLRLSADAGITWSIPSTATTPGAWTSLSASHSGKHLTAQSMPVVQPNQAGLAAATWTQQGVTWTVSASTEYSGTYPALRAFNKVYDVTGWASSALYDPTTGAYTIGSSTTIQDGVGTIAGEWIQLQVSSPLVLQSYSYSVGGNVAQIPKTYYLVGSNNGSTWYPLQYVAMSTNPFNTTSSVASSTITVNYTGTQTIIGNLTGSGSTTAYSYSTTPYLYFRLVCVAIWPSNLGSVQLGEFLPNFLGGSITPNLSGLSAATWSNSGVTWTVSASTTVVAAGYTVYNGFNNALSASGSDNWATNGGYNGTTGEYSPLTYNTTVITSAGVSTTVSGEWLQLQASVPLVLQSYAYGPQVTFIYQLPKTYYIVGSNDGTTWYALHSMIMTTNPYASAVYTPTSYVTMNYTGTQVVTGNQSGVGTSTAYAYTTNAYTYFRLIATSIYGTAGAAFGLGEFLPVFAAGQNASLTYGSTWTPTLQSSDAFNLRRNVTVTTGGSGWVALPSFRPVSTGLTFSLWVTFTSTPAQYSKIFEAAATSPNPTNTISIQANGSGGLLAGQYVNSTFTPLIPFATTFSNNTLYHLVWSIDATGAHRLYVNGTLDATGSGTINVISYPYFGIGKDNFGGPYPGMVVSDFRMFHRGLTATEVTTLYQNLAYGISAAPLMTFSKSGQYSLVGDGFVTRVDNNYLSTYSTTSSVVKSPSGINAPIVGTAVSQSGQTMVLVTAGTTNNVYHSNDYGATFTGLTLGSSPMVSCAVSYDGSSFSVMNTTGVVYTLNANSTGNTLAIGLDAGKVNQGTNAVAIGNKAGQVNQTAGSIVINATGSIVGTGVAGFYVSPIKNHLHSSDSMINLLGYGADNQIVQSNLSFNTSNLLTPDGIYAANPLYNNTLNLIGYSPSIPSVSGTNVLGGTFFLNSTNSWGYNVGASIALGGRGYNWGAGNLHMSFARISGVQQNNSIAYLGSFVVETANQGMMYERMRIDGNGNVGMGTDTPATKLHVVGTVTANTYTAPAGNWLAITNGAGSGRIDLQGGSILMQNAYVGIGTTVPGHALHVAGNVRATGHWFWEPSTNWYCDANANNQEFSFDLRNQGTYTGCYWHVWSDKNNRQILVVRGDTERVGIGPGVINPGYTLHVDGTIYASGEITGLSDQRYKKDIEPLTDSLTKVTQLRGVSYRHLDQETDKTHMGLLAQEVAEVYPDTVSYDEKNDRYSLNYISLIAPMIESIKALKAEVETLKSELRELRGV